jgi:response regulator RpfG family c-di-GMP phosphodiesterase
MNETAEKAPAASLAVMAVDDEPENLDLIERTLFSNFDVRTFESAQRALDALATQPYSVILSDQRCAPSSPPTPTSRRRSTRSTAGGSAPS